MTGLVLIILVDHSPRVATEVGFGSLLGRIALTSVAHSAKDPVRVKMPPFLTFGCSGRMKNIRPRKHTVLEACSMGVACGAPYALAPHPHLERIRGGRMQPF
ncbi:hypothetical protein C8Q77DRAFT_614504 [Trametes polyzona]|nr:hypothetical protein C8Q77DRAFT_614504 [Trametes polyzona]